MIARLAQALFCDTEAMTAEEIYDLAEADLYTELQSMEGDNSLLRAQNESLRSAMRASEKNLCASEAERATLRAALETITTTKGYRQAMTIAREALDLLEYSHEQSRN